MTTRDSQAWWWVIAGAVITAVAAQTSIIDPLLPAAHTEKVHAWINLAAMIVGVVGGVMKASPLPISDAGRLKYPPPSPPDAPPQL
jgi:uncharacterized membrane protein HdeD (DUF308 family)